MFHILFQSYRLVISIYSCLCFYFGKSIAVIYVLPVLYSFSYLEKVQYQFVREACIRYDNELFIISTNYKQMTLFMVFGISSCDCLINVIREDIDVNYIYD